MRSVTYWMGMSLDGYVVGPDGGFDWTEPDDELFQFAIDQIQEVGVHLLGRKLYEAMLYWETAEEATLSEAFREWKRLWMALPKVVFSTTLTTVEGSNTRLATGDLAAEIAGLRTEPDEGHIAIGGPTLAHQAAQLGLIDEYRPRVHPVLVGGGLPYFAQHEQRVDLELLDERLFATTGVRYLRYRVARQAE
ncbi:MAG TPA: dihydrofolate reductase family protein [Sporichthya sp.]|nr:dihydrofolate reductase family protein [Sporichthya sp.]